IDANFVVKMGACGAAGRTDIADNLALSHLGARTDAGGKLAHMAVKRLVLAAVLDLHRDAIGTEAASYFDLAIPGVADRRSVRCAEVDACMHLVVAEQGMAAHAIARC